MATPVGLEPTTPGLEVQCSNPTELRGHRISILTKLAAHRVKFDELLRWQTLYPTELRARDYPDSEII
jgi:hypothetical protein